MITVTEIDESGTIEVWTTTGIEIQNGRLKFHDAIIVRTGESPSRHVNGVYDPPQNSKVIIT